jgi:hypothetical protein
MRRPLVALALGLVLVAMGGCATERPIPNLPPSDCVGTGTELMRLHGDADATEPVWFVGVASGQRYSVYWPSGYRAVFTPWVEIRSRIGTTVAREGDTLDVNGSVESSSVSICNIITVNGVPPPWEPVPTAVPVPTRRPTGDPPPIGTGSIDIEVWGEVDDDIEEIPLFVVRFEALEGQPDAVFPVFDAGLEKRTYRVPAGRYELVIEAPGWLTVRGDQVEIRPHEDSGSIGVGLWPATPAPQPP